MKRLLIALVTTLPLAFGVAAAQATTPGFPGFPGTGGTGTQQAMVAGTVVSVDAGAGTFVANAYVLTPPSMGSGSLTGTGWGSGAGSSGFGFGGTSGSGSGSGAPSGFGSLGGVGSLSTPRTPASDMPTATEVTITTNSSTTIRVGGVTGTATVADLVPGAQFLAIFPGSSGDTIQTLVAGPATSIYAQVPKQFYAFVGTLTATDPTAGTLTVDVSRSLPGSLITGGTTGTFTVSSHTFVIGGSSLKSGGFAGLFGGLFGGSLSDVSTGDMVAGGVIADTGLTAAQVEATPLMFLLDLPAPTSATTTGTTSGAESRALTETVKVLHGAKVKLRKSHRRSKESKHVGRR
jgi:hypothetical protein